MKKHNIKVRIIVSAFALIITAFCTVLSAVIPLETTPVKTAGSFASIFIITAAAWKFPDRFYLLAMIFDIFAAALGSVINLYRYIGFYDRFVHYLSGILLAEAGMLIILYLLKKYDLAVKNDITLLFAFFFSSACAGFWEIYEFTADNLLNINMQGNNRNTMGDIVSGVLGAATYFIFMGLYLKRKKHA